MGFDGTVHARAEVALEPHEECGLPAATLRARVPESLLEAADRTREVLVARIVGPTVSDEASGESACWFLAPDADLALPTAEFDRVDALRCRARTLIRELWIDGADSASSSGWRTVLPGEEFELAEGDIWWSANAFGLDSDRASDESKNR
jgi:hypothetical protein